MCDLADCFNLVPHRSMNLLPVNLALPFLYDREGFVLITCVPSVLCMNELFRTSACVFAALPRGLPHCTPDNGFLFVGR